MRHDYLYVLNQLFIERWAKPYSEWCEKNKIEFTGHYWEHDWPQCTRVPDNMAMYAWHQPPSIDNLMNTYSETLHAQFGNTRTVKELSSVANQMGRTRTLCEAYGAGGWDLRFEDMKRIGDWLYVLGVNTLDPHLSYITIRGARKRDHPQSFSYHEPWWEAYHISAEYFARLSAAMSQGKQVNDMLVIEPTTTAWMYNNDTGDNAELTKLGTSFESWSAIWSSPGRIRSRQRGHHRPPRLGREGGLRRRPTQVQPRRTAAAHGKPRHQDGGPAAAVHGCRRDGHVPGRHAEHGRRPSISLRCGAGQRLHLDADARQERYSLLRGRQRATGMGVYPKTDTGNNCCITIASKACGVACRPRGVRARNPSWMR